MRLRPPHEHSHKDACIQVFLVVNDQSVWQTRNPLELQCCDVTGEIGSDRTSRNIDDIITTVQRHRPMRYTPEILKTLIDTHQTQSFKPNSPHSEEVPAPSPLAP